MRELLVALAVSTPFVLGASLAEDRDGEEAFRFTDPAIVESSGLVAAGDYLVTVNDSGDWPRVFVVDPTSGDTVGVTRWSVQPDDVEALAPAGNNEVWVGDIGDNDHERASVTVWRIPIGLGWRTVAGAAYELVMPEPDDAEALLTDPATGRLHIVTKSISGGVVYAAPTTLDAAAPNRMERVAEVAGLVTDGSFFPDGRHLMLRNYTTGFVYTFPDFELVDSFPLPTQQQGEGLAITAEDRVLISSEGVRSPVLEVRLPDEVTEVLEARPETPAAADDGPARQPDESPPSDASADRGGAVLTWWPWAAGGVLGLGLLAVAVRVLRR